MKKLILALGLTATVVTSLAVTAPVRADGTQILPQLVQPDLSDLHLRPAPVIDKLLFPVLRAELTSQLFVFYGYNPVFNPHPYPGYPVIWCYVKNSGYIGTGWFKTLIRIQRYGTPYVIQAYATMNLPAGGGTWVGLRVYAPYGLKQVFSFADIGYTVPEYNESNNWDTVP
jgi:hypothetical protein